MAWCRQAASYNLKQCWPSSMMPYGVTRPLWVNLIYTCIYIYIFIYVYVSHMQTHINQHVCPQDNFACYEWITYIYATILWFHWTDTTDNINHNHDTDTNFTNGLWAQNWNLMQIIFALIFILMMQSGDHFAYVTTCQSMCKIVTGLRN